MEKVGKTGVITVQEGKTMEDSLEITEGMRFDRGFISPYLVTDPKTQKAEFEDAVILITEKKISSMADLLPALDHSIQTRRPLLIIAEDVDGEALATLVLNKLRGTINVTAVKAPGFGDNRKATLHDIAILTGGQVMSDELDNRLDQVKPEQLGRAKKISVTKDNTIILNGAGSKQSVLDRCEEIELQIKETKSDYEKEKLQERLAKLSGGVAVIKVGGASEVEVGEKKDRIVDALNATRAAVEEGIVPGGGVALLYSTRVLDNVKPANFDQARGVELIRQALAAPIRRIVDNAGGVEGAVVAGELLRQDNVNWGYDAQNGVYTDMIQAGIIDPTKVVRTALVDAASVASLLATTDCMITEMPKEEAPVGAGMGGMGGMGGMM